MQQMTTVGMFEVARTDKCGKEAVCAKSPQVMWGFRQATPLATFWSALSGMLDSVLDEVQLVELCA